MMNEEVLEQFLEKYLQGRASIDEINQVKEWYNSFDLQEDLYVGDTLELRQLVAKQFIKLKATLGIK